MTLRISTVVVEERHEPLPRAYPQAADGRVLVGPPAEYLIARRLGGGLVDGGVHRDEIPPDGAPVALGRVPERVAHQVDDARLHDRLLPDHADRRRTRGWRPACP